MPSVVLVTGGYDHNIRFWEAPTGICPRAIQYTDSQINALAISPDKQVVAAVGMKTVRLYEVNSNNPSPLASLEGHTGNVTSVGFEKDSRWMFTGGEDNTIRVWDLRTMNCERTFTADGAVNSVILHPSQGELYSGDQCGMVRRWDLTADDCSHSLVPEDPDVAVRSVAVSVTGSETSVIAATNTGMVHGWNPDRDTAPEVQFQAHKKYILKAVVSPDGKQLATASADRTVKLWSLQHKVAQAEAETQTPLTALPKETPETQKHLAYKWVKSLIGHQRWVWDCAYSSDSAFLVTASSDHTARLWDINRGEKIRVYNGHQKPVVCVALNDLRPQ